MDILIFNAIWMTWNTFLAFLGVFLGFLLLKSTNKFLLIVLSVLWLLIIPNSIYLLTDTIHILPEWQQVTLFIKPFLLLQYLVLCIVSIITFVGSVYCFEMMLSHNIKSIATRRYLIIYINICIAFGVTIGRFQRTNSWHILTDPVRVVKDILTSFSSVEQVLFLVGFAVLGNVLYFGIVSRIQGRY